MIEFAGVETRALRLSSLAIPPGITAVIGRNGAGKTTLLELCCGLLLPEAGSILVDGRLPRETDSALVPAFPGPPLLFARVRDELAASGRFAGLPPDKVEGQVAIAAEATGARDLLDRSTRSLSGGERFVVSLAAALASGPAILALDEFDGALDAETLEGLLSAVRDSGARYVLWATHDPELAALADRAVALEKGRVSATGDAALAIFDAWEAGG